MHTTDIELEIYRFIVDNFMFGQAGGLRYDESLLQKGVIDSTGVLELVTFLQDNFKITVEDDEVIPANLETVNGIVAYVGKKLNGNSLGDLHHAS
jgi:acyl carrier protein